MYFLFLGRYPELQILRDLWKTATIIPVLSYICDGNEKLCLLLFVVYCRYLLLNRFMFELTDYQQNRRCYSLWTWQSSFVYFWADE